MYSENKTSKRSTNPSHRDSASLCLKLVTLRVLPHRTKSASLIYVTNLASRICHPLNDSCRRITQLTWLINASRHTATLFGSSPLSAGTGLRCTVT
jgi:hypothetical protein